MNIYCTLRTTNAYRERKHVFFASPLPKLCSSRDKSLPNPFGFEGKQPGLGRGGHSFFLVACCTVQKGKIRSSILPTKLASYSSACAIEEMKGRMLDAESELENGARSNQNVWKPRLLQINLFSVATAIAWTPGAQRSSTPS